MRSAVWYGTPLQYYKRQLRVHDVFIDTSLSHIYRGKRASGKSSSAVLYFFVSPIFEELWCCANKKESALQDSLSVKLQIHILWIDVNDCDHLVLRPTTIALHIPLCWHIDSVLLQAESVCCVQTQKWFLARIRSECRKKWGRSSSDTAIACGITPSAASQKRDATKLVQFYKDRSIPVKQSTIPLLIISFTLKGTILNKV